MPFSAGVYSLPTPALVPGQTVASTENNTSRNDFATALNLTMLRNGTSTATANLPMGGYKLTGLGVATTSGDALSYGQAATVSTLTATGAVTLSGGTANGVAYLNGSKVLTSGSALTFDGSNLGLGVTPSAWGSGFKSVDVGTVASISSDSSGAFFSKNAYDSTGSGGWTYKTTGAAQLYLQQSTGGHNWYTAPSGTAGNAISFTQAMTLDASGNLSVGTTYVGASGISVASGDNLSFAEGSNSSLTNLFRQANSGASILASGYKYTVTADKFASSYASSWAKSAISVGGGSIRFYADTATTVAVGTDITPTERMRIDSSGNLLQGITTNTIGGITTTSVFTGSMFAYAGSTAGTQTSLYVGNSGNQAGNRGGSIDIVSSGNGLGVSGARSTARITSASEFAGSQGAYLTLSTENTSGAITERIRINSAGYIQLSASSGGIQFNGDTAAANALDDYEEGTFTPVAVGTTTAGTGTYSLQSGRYTKVGNRVIYSLYLAWSAHTGTGNLRIQGLPYTGESSIYNCAAVWAAGLTLTANNVVMAYHEAGSAYVIMQQSPVGGGSAVNVAMDAAVGGLMLSGSYNVP